MEITVYRGCTETDVGGKLVRYIRAAVVISLVLFPIMCYTYYMGGVDGVMRYKKSSQFALTLYSMYRFGVMDGMATCKGGNK